MTTRHAHLVGSLPGADAETAMRTAMEVLGPRLRTLPDGETGDRRNWVISTIESLRAHPDLELTSDGDWSDYDRLPRFRVRRGHRLYGATLDLGNTVAARESLPAFEKVRADHHRPDLAFQLGVPSDLDLALFVFGPVAALRRRRAFTEATVREIHDQYRSVGPDAVFQLETPVELALLAQAPRPARPALARVLARGITALVAAAPAGARFGVHLCIGDLNNRSLTGLPDTAPLVQLSNAIAHAWPDGRRWEFLHAPLAAGNRPAPTDPAFYAPLSRLRLGPEVRFAAGFAHESQSLDDQLRIRDLLDARLGQPVDVAAACGLGRRSADTAHTVLRRTEELCRD